MNEKLYINTFFNKKKHMNKIKDILIRLFLVRNYTFFEIMLLTTGIYYDSIYQLLIFVLSRVFYSDYYRNLEEK